MFLQFLNPMLKKFFNLKKINSFEIINTKINQLVKTNAFFKIGKKKDINEEDMEFILKNCIDISGEIDMTKPPKFYWERDKSYKTTKILNNKQTSLNSLVGISICPLQLFSVDKSTIRKIEVFIKNYSYLYKNPMITYKEIFFREFNYWYLLSIPFLCSSIFFSLIKFDFYNIEPKKICSCDLDLDTNYYLSLCSNLIPKFTFYTGKQINFKQEECITKADEKKLVIFYEKFSKILGKKDKSRELLIEYGYIPNKELYSNTFGHLSIRVYVNQFYNIEFVLRYELKNVAYSYSLGRNHFSLQCEPNIDCTKQGLEKEGDLNYLYIKYLKYPIIFGDYNTLSFVVEFAGARTFFGPEIIYV